MYVPVTFRDFAENNDPALNLILDYKENKN